jgi:hypothetical protein
LRPRLFQEIHGGARLARLPAAPGDAGRARPEAFFVGRTEGEGTAHIILSGRHAVRVHSRGRLEPGGALLLDQVVEEDGKPPRRRSWRILRAGANRITGTITDARGPIQGTFRGNRLDISYRSTDGPAVEQHIIIQPGGRTATNRMTFRRFGIVIATMEETIRRVD